MKNNCPTSNRRGFTLIELVLVIGIMALLAIVVLTSIKPAQRLVDTRNARRAQDLNQILTAIHECAIDKKDSATMSTCLGVPVVGDTYEIVTGSITSGCQAVCTGATSDSSCLRLDTKLSDYFINLPTDPSGVATSHTGYSVSIKSNGMTVLEACAAEGTTIKTSR